MGNSTRLLGGVGYCGMTAGLLIFLLFRNPLLAMLSAVIVAVMHFMLASDPQSPRIRNLTIAAIVLVATSLYLAIGQGGIRLPDAVFPEAEAAEAQQPEQPKGKSQPPEGKEPAGAQPEKAKGAAPAEETAPKSGIDRMQEELLKTPEGRRRIIIAGLIAWFLGIIAASMWFEIYKTVAVATGIKLFRSGGLLIFLGSMIPIAGVILVESGYIALAAAFFKVKS